jgi:hypothetical protein
MKHQQKKKVNFHKSLPTKGGLGRDILLASATLSSLPPMLDSTVIKVLSLSFPPMYTK